MANGESKAQLQGNPDVYFDEALRSANVFPDPALPSVSYLHVTVNPVNVTAR